MVCIYCGSPTQVVNSRRQRRQNHIWRRRLCSVCGGIFTTHELPDLGGSVMVRKADNKKLVPFSRDLLFVGIYEACRHRPGAATEAAELTETIVAKLLPLVQKGTVDIKDITAMAAQTLNHFDKDAATIYSAYHPL